MAEKPKKKSYLISCPLVYCKLKKNFCEGFLSKFSAPFKICSVEIAIIIHMTSKPTFMKIFTIFSSYRTCHLYSEKITARNIFWFIVNIHTNNFKCC